MALIRTKTVRPAAQKINPIQKRASVGVQEDGYFKQFMNRTKRIPKATRSAETDNPNGKSFGTKVQ